MTDDKQYVEIEHRPIEFQFITIVFFGSAVVGYWMGHPIVGEFNWVSYFGGLWTGIFGAVAFWFFSQTETKKVPVKSKDNE